MTTHDLPGNQTILCGDVRECLRELPEGSVQCVVTSPPYWQQRDYGTARWEGGDPECDHMQAAIRTRRNLAEAANAADGGHRRAEDRSDHEALGLPYTGTCGKCGAMRVDSSLGNEPTPDQYMANMVEVFREVRRVLRDDGCLWLNLGDSYANTGCDPTKCGGKTGAAVRRNRETGNGWIQDSTPRRIPDGLKPKDLVGIPWRVALALQADGWWLRSDVIWEKGNPMPESCTDRPTKAHEYIFLLSKSERYFFDQDSVREPLADSSVARLSQPTFDSQTGGAKDYGHRTNANRSARKAICNLREKLVAQEKWGDRHEGWEARDKSIGRNIRSVWLIPTKGYDGAHFATFPEAIPERCLKAGTSERGCCPKCGKPWRRVVERTDEPDTSAKGSRFDAGKTGARDGGDRTQAGERTLTRSVGFAPGCTCDAGDPVPCTILDPFAGSGTTLAVAKRMKLRGIGIELNPEYVELARERIALAGYRTGADRREARTLLSSPTLFDEVAS